MPSPPHAARSRPALLLATLTLASLGACARDAPAPPPTRVPAPTRAAATPPPRRPPPPDTLAARTPRPAAMVFDTVAPPRPAPAPPETPKTPEAPRAPRPAAPPRVATRPPGPAGSCDVRPAETYCFAYAGPAWTPASAAANCAGAPRATFRTEPCPTPGRIATCVFRRDSEPDRELVYTTYAPASLDLARLACPGTFTVIDGDAEQ